MPDTTSNISDPSTSSTRESSQGTNLRLLLPAPHPHPVRTHAGHRIAPLERRVPISLACESCRQRKSKCNGARPMCSQCRIKHTDCIYRQTPEDIYSEKLEALQVSHPAAVIYRAIQTRPEAEVHEIIRRIRTGSDAETVAHQLSTADFLLQVQMEPETRCRYQFLYSPSMPSYLQTSTNPFIHTLIHEWNENDHAGTISVPPLWESEEKCKAQYLRPVHAASIVDSRMDEIIPSKWTTVNADDDLMRTLIRAYFLYEYDWFTFFHKDYFLDDMLAGSSTFCSPLLVNAILAVGCHCQNHLSQPAEFWNPNSLGYRFLAEAKRLWAVEEFRERSLTTLQAALIINTIVNMFGIDKLASAYLVQAIDIARELGLFEPTTYIKHKKLRHSYDLTAWSLFHWQCTLSLQFQTAPLLRTPPHSPLPDPDLDPDWYSEIWLKYPSTSVLVPMQYRYTFKARVEFSLILNAAMLQASTNESDNQVVQSGAGRMIETIEKLEAWYRTLPDPLLPSNIVFPSQLKLHLHYCYVLIQLYEILASYGNNGSPPLLLDQDKLQRSLTHYRAYFETILRIHYLRHSFEHGNMMLPQFLTMLAFLALNKLDSLRARDSSKPNISSMDVGDTDPRAAKATLLIAQKGLSDQGRGYYVAKNVLQDVLDRMTLSDSNVLQSFITVQREGREVAEERKIHMESHCPPGIIHIANNPDRQQHGNWIRRFAKLTVGEESAGSILDMIFGVLYCT
ncbi:Nitrogen assimilation transcription factor nirA [Fusarium oxysporum f. sp. raphani]|uniref:Nitrogen assimilation transcription factor nirA n=1 Tax=Fusarium oxysporum f. sp. raphani TaxID=96318 RepID=A0A8J5P971_FUSOX|nr:Nitrogen assimilation transcription factor nirA [Fusarium oxysporum f. sp. raphani]